MLQRGSNSLNQIKLLSHDCFSFLELYEILTMTRATHHEAQISDFKIYPPKTQKVRRIKYDTCGQFANILDYISVENGRNV